MKKIFKTLAYSFLILIFTLFGLIYFMGMTTDGLRLTLNLLAHEIPGKLAVEQVSGKLFSEFNLKNISYTDSNQQTFIKTLHFSWNPFFLLQKKIMIQNMSLDQVQINLMDNSPPKTDSHFDWNTLTLLHSVILKQADINNLVIHGVANGLPIKGSANITFKENQLEIHNTLLAIANSTVTLSGTLKKAWNIQWQINALKLENLIPGVQGNLTSSGTITGPQLSPKVNATLKVNSFSYGQQSITLTSESKLIDKKLLTNLKLIISNNQNQITGIITLPEFAKKMDFDLDQSIESKFTLNFNELKSLIPSTPYTKYIKGILIGEASITGTLAHPIFDGNLAFKDGHIKITKLGVKLNNINLNANYDKNNLIKFNGRFQSGDGFANIQGKIIMKEPALMMDLQGTDLEVSNTREYQIHLSPNLTLTANNNEMTVQGKISVPYADINASRFNNITSLPSDVVIVDRPEAPSHLPSNLSMQIHLKLGNDVHLAYDALKTNLGGNLQIIQNKGGSPYATGELYTLKGNYRAYGHTMMIEKGGRLLFTGSPLNNPGLDIKAVKKIKRSTMSTGSEEITVGVQLSGTASQSKIALFSSPPGLSQGDILSYIIFGYPQAQVSGSKSLALLSAATSTLNLGGNKINKMTEKIEKYLGHIDIGSESVETFNPKSNLVESSTTLGIGKQLAPNLYLHYSVGNGVDLMYGFEFD